MISPSPGQTDGGTSGTPDATSGGQGGGSLDPWTSNYLANSSTSSSSGSSGSSGSIDYSQMFAAFGMTPDMIKQINELMAKLISSGMSSDDAYNTVVGEIRGGQIGANYKNGQSWYDYTYAGISYGIANGLLDSSNPEASYRDYVNAINQYYQEYFGRDATTAEIVGYVQGGTSVSTAGAQLKGQSYANAYASGDANAMGYSWNALLGSFGQLPNGETQLSDTEKTALGESMTGYSTPLGDQLNKQLQTAYRRLQTIFRGQLATPADLQKGGSGLKAPSLASEATPDVAPI